MELTKLPIYKLWLMKPNIEVTRLSPQQYADMEKLHNEAEQKVGAKSLLMAETSWSNEEFTYFGIQEFPNLDALFEFHDCLNQIHWFDYMACKTYIGFSIDIQGNPVPFVPPPPPEPGTKPLYKVAVARPTRLYYEDPKGVEELSAKIQEAGERAGMVVVMGAYTRWNNEESEIFLLERYPSLDAFGEKYMLMEKLGWYRYMDAKSYLGRAISGLLAG